MEAPCKKKDSPPTSNRIGVAPAEKSTTAQQPTNAATQDSNTKESSLYPTRVKRRFTDTPSTTLQQQQQQQPQQKAPVTKDSGKDKASKDTHSQKIKIAVLSQPSSVYRLRQLSIDERDDVVMDILPSPTPPVVTFVNKSVEKKDVPAPKNDDSVDKVASEKTSDKKNEAQDQQPKTNTVVTGDNGGSPAIEESKKSSEEKVIEEPRLVEHADESERGSQLVPEHREAAATTTEESNHVHVSSPAAAAAAAAALPVDAQAVSISKDTEQVESTTNNTKISSQSPVIDTSNLTTPAQSPTTTATTPTSATITSPLTSIDPLSRPKKKRGRLPPHWKVKMTDDDFYYVNTLTGEETFTRPEI